MDPESCSACSNVLTRGCHENAEHSRHRSANWRYGVDVLVRRVRSASMLEEGLKQIADLASPQTHYTFTGSRWDQSEENRRRKSSDEDRRFQETHRCKTRLGCPETS